MQHDDQPRTGRGTRSFILPLLIVLIVVALVMLHVTGVLGPGSH